MVSSATLLPGPESRPKRPIDRYVLWAALALAVFGVVAVYSAISFLAETRAGGDTERFLVRHLVRVGVAFAALLACSAIDYRKLARFSRIALLVSLGLLVVVHIAGVTWGGATRWLRIGSVGFQPSDLARVALILYVGVLLAKKQAYIASFTRSFLPLMVWVLGACILIGMEDLSSALMLLATTMLMCFVARVRATHLAGLCAAGLALALLLVLVSPNRAARLESYLGMDLFPPSGTEDVAEDRGEGYQAQQARIAFAMGGLTGVGPGKSTQRDFLPAPYNDFIFAIVAEEYGLLGAMALLAAFSILLFRGFLRIARPAPDPLGLFLGAGFTTSVALYAFVHAAVACGLLPVTGLPLPFVSYGGTSMAATGMMFGILLNISRQCAAR